MLSIYEQRNSNYVGVVFLRRAPDGAGQVSAELQSIPSACWLRYAPARCFPSTLCFFPSFSFTPSFVFPNTEGLNEMFHRPRGACFLRRETRRKRSRPGEDKLDGAATWAALCLIFFIIIGSPLFVPKSHISPSLMCH